MGVFLRVSVVVAATGLDLDVLGEVDDQREVVELRFVDGLLAVVDEVGSK